MRWIQSIEIEHFRSIYNLRVDNLSDINVFSGLNDMGKSNVLKALNLFFNDNVDWKTPLDFDLDTNTFHAYRSRNGKIRKVISVKLNIRLPENRYKTLNSNFWIKREWDKDHLLPPLQTWGAVGTDEERTDTTRGLTEFLNRSTFFYVPAVRGRDYLRDLLRQFSESIADRPDAVLKAASKSLSSAIEERSLDLRSELARITGLSFMFELPQDLMALLEAAALMTEGQIPLGLRGDGVQGLTVPAILSYLSSRSTSNYYFWGFEEPENSLEYRNGVELANNLQKAYEGLAQIFMTSHSPAFLAMKGSSTSIYRVKQEFETYQRTSHSELVTKTEPVIIRGEDMGNELLPEELGLFEIAREYDKEFRERFEIQNTKIESLESQIQRLSQPVLLVEGSHDVKTLNYAWRKLYRGAMPFKIVDADNAKAITELVKGWNKVNDERVFALYDHDTEGISAIKNLGGKKYQLSSSSRLHLVCTYNEKVLAMTLPVPALPERTGNAINHNLTMEFYFPDSVLKKIDATPGCELFNRFKYIKVENNKKHEPYVGKKGLADLIQSGVVTMGNRQVIEPGKSCLIGSLNENEIDDSHFSTFHSLFKKIVDHLKPEFELRLRAKFEMIE